MDLKKNPNSIGPAGPMVHEKLYFFDFSIEKIMEASKKLIHKTM